MQDYRRLDVWRKSHGLCLDIYRATRGFPREEIYGLTAQMRRCAVSIPSNIAEGCGRGSNPDFARFLHTSMGSANELEYQMLLAGDLGYLEKEAYDGLAIKMTGIKQMLARLIQKVMQS
jgi:four helix bundle protein